MLNLNINEKRTLDFEVQLSGVNSEQLKGSLRFEINNIEYGFPAEFKSESILVNVPPLSSIISDSLKEGTTLKANLEVNANGFYLTPWSGEFVISNPIKMEAKIRGEDMSETPKVVTKLVSEEDKIDIPEDDLETTIKNKLSEAYKKEKVVKPKSKPRNIPKKKSGLNNITEEQIYKYMNYMGTKDKKIQNILYEKSKELCGTDDLKDIFKGVYKLLKRR